MVRLELVRVLRRLRDSPRFSLAVVASIALAIGPVVGAASLVDAVFLRNLAAKTPHTLFAVRSARDLRGRSDASPAGVSFPDCEDLRASLPAPAARSFAAWKVRDASRTSTRGDQPLRFAAIAGDYFRIADAHFIHGAAPGDEEDAVVVTPALWRELQTEGESGNLTIYDQRFRVAGVVDDAFRGLHVDEGVDAWVPIAALPRLEGSPDLLSYRELDDLSVLVQTPSADASHQLAPSVAAVGARLAEFHGGRRYGWRLEAGRAQPGWRELLRTRRGQAAFAPLLVMLCLLLIAATNVANLFVVRAAARESERALQLALGMPRRRQLLAECLEPLVLGAFGLVAGLGVGAGATRVLARFALLERLRLESSAASIVAGCVAAGIFVGLCALVPTLRLRRLRAADVIREGHGVTGRGVSRLQRSYLVLQFTLALGFLCVAVQIAAAARQLSTVNVGFDTTKLIVIKGARGALHRTPAQWLADYHRVVTATSALRGVEAVSASIAEYFGGYAMMQRPVSRTPGPPESWDLAAGGFYASMDVVAPGYFAALGLPIRDGGDFSDAAPGAVREVLVNETFARRIADPGHAVGTTFYELGGNPLRIVGVVPDIRATAAEQVRPAYYRSFVQSTLPSFVLYVRVATLSPAQRTALVAAIVRELPESAGHLRITTAEEQRRQRDLPAIAMFWVSTALAVIAMLVTGIGLYGVASNAMVARRREFGIRAALGASPGRLGAMVLGEGMRWTGLATATSLPFVWIGMKVATTLVVGARKVPALAVVALVAAYVVVVVLALALPALRAAHVQVSRTLRSL